MITINFPDNKSVMFSSPKLFIDLLFMFSDNKNSIKLLFKKLFIL